MAVQQGDSTASPSKLSFSLSPFSQSPKTLGLRPMEHKDIVAVHKLMSEYLKQFHLTPVMTPEEVEHWFLPQPNIIDTFVVEVRCFLFFYTLFLAFWSRDCKQLWFSASL